MNKKYTGDGGLDRAVKDFFDKNGTFFLDDQSISNHVERFVRQSIFDGETISEVELGLACTNLKNKVWSFPLKKGNK